MAETMQGADDDGWFQEAFHEIAAAVEPEIPKLFGINTDHTGTPVELWFDLDLVDADDDTYIYLDKHQMMELYHLLQQWFPAED